jgi:hypothetical protein
MATLEQILAVPKGKEDRENFRRFIKDQLSEIRRQVVLNKGELVWWGTEEPGESEALKAEREGHIDVLNRVTGKLVAKYTYYEEQLALLGPEPKAE